MRCLSFAIVAASALSGSIGMGADEHLEILKTAPGSTPPSRQLYKALEAGARTHFEARRKTVSALKTPTEFAEYQRWSRDKFLTALGGLPEKTPLNPKVIGSEQRDGYRVERVVYESRPGHQVTALFYLPDGKPPFPGVLVPCGHEASGKAGETYQRVSILMAKNGLAVLCYDPIGQGERAQLLDSTGRPAFSGSTSEHTAVGLGALLVGRSAAGYRVWDGIRSIDYLVSRAEVDPARIGCTGNSGGGTLTAYLMALDDRIAVAAPSCYITSLERLYATIGPQDAEQNLVGQVANGLDHADFVIMRSPKPTLLCVGTRDFFDIQGSWDTYQEVKRVYGKLGFGERVDLFESDEPHGFTKPRREATVRWMRRWLLGKDEATVEPEFAVAPEQKLWATSTGQVLSRFHGRSAFDLNVERARELAQVRAAKRRTREELLKEVRQTLELGRTPEEWVEDEFQKLAPGTLATSRRWIVEVDRLTRNSFDVRKWTLETERGVTLPILRIAKPQVVPHTKAPTVVVVGGDRRSLMSPGGLAEREASAGRSVMLVDLRGMGETAPAGPTAKALGAFGDDWQEAFLGLGLNRPLISQRIRDLLRVLDAIAIKDEVHLVGIEAAAPVALHVAALDRRITKLTLERPSTSWTAAVNVPSTRGELANVIPGVLKTYDLPDLTASFAPRPLLIVDPRDPTGHSIDAKAAELVHEGTRASYRAASAEGSFQIQVKP